MKHHSNKFTNALNIQRQPSLFWIFNILQNCENLKCPGIGGVQSLVNPTLEFHTSNRGVQDSTPIHCDWVLTVMSGLLNICKKVNSLS